MNMIKKNFNKKDRDVNKLQLSTTKDKASLIKVAYKYLITTEKFIALATVNECYCSNRQKIQWIYKGK